MHLVRFPTLEDLSNDLSQEIGQFCGYLDRLFTSHYEKRPAGKIVHLKCTIVQNRAVASEFVEWTLRLLADRRFACKSFFREALQLVAQHSAEFRALHPDDRPSNSERLALLEKHRQCSKSASQGKTLGALTMFDWWMTTDDPLAMLLMMNFAENIGREHINSLRMFAAKCAALDGVHPQFCEVVEQYTRQKVADTELVALRREIRRALSDYYANEYSKDPSYAVLVELGFRPLERICSPSIGWVELCDVSHEICSTVIARCGNSEKLAADLREAVSCPWPTPRKSSDPAPIE
jgi:hypothetical protein